MINLELGPVFMGLAAAASYGAADFTGGLATKRNSVYSVVIISQAVGGLGLLALALLAREALPAPRDLLLGAAAGVSGAAGLVLFYRGLAEGRMGVVAPLTAMMTAVLPVLAGMLLAGWPTAVQFLGFLLALLAVWLISAAGNGGRLRPRDLLYPVIAGLSFGLFFVLIDQVSAGVVLWPLVAARVASVTFMLLFVWGARRGRVAVGRGQWGIIILGGLLDAGGNLFFVLASQLGRLDIAAVLASLYPAVTVLLARLVLDERLNGRQWVGVAAALVAVVALSV